MKAKILLLLFLVSPLLAEDPKPVDPFIQNLFAPELILQNYAEIDLTERQRDSVVTAIRRQEQKAPVMQAQLEKERSKLAEFLSEDQVDTDQALEQLERLHAAEGEMKRSQLSLLLNLKNLLTPSQQAKLAQIKKENPGKPPLEALRKKMEAFEAGVQEWQNSGKDPTPIAEQMQQLEPLMREAKFKEAEALLDKVLKMLKD